MQNGTLTEALKLEIKKSKVLHSSMTMPEDIANDLIKIKSNKH